MPPSPHPRADGLDVETIVEAAAAVIDGGGLRSLSMRRLGAELGVDPMAVYHHVPNKQALLALVLARALGRMSEPGPGTWDQRVRAWALSYWGVVVDNGELVAAALADPEIAAAAAPATGPLSDAVADSGIDPRLVEPNVWLLVDAVHGSALAGRAADRRVHGDRERLRAAFEIGLDTIVAGIAAQAARRP